MHPFELLPPIQDLEQRRLDLAERLRVQQRDRSREGGEG